VFSFVNLENEHLVLDIKYQCGFFWWEINKGWFWGSSQFK